MPLFTSLNIINVENSQPKTSDPAHLPFAGTTGKFERIEAIQIAVVKNLEPVKENATAELQDYVDLTAHPEATEALNAGLTAVNSAETVADVKKAVADAKATIDSVIALQDAKVAAVAQLEEYKNFMNDEGNPDYKSEAKAIEKAISDIQKADSEEKVQELLDKAVNGVSAAAKEAMEDLKEAKSNALADLQKYVDASKDLDKEDKARLQSFVNEASKKIKAANSEDGVKEAVDTFNELMNASKTLEAVAVQKAKNDAKDALNECRDSSKPTLNKLIDEAIEEIDEMNSVEAIEGKMNELLSKEEGELGSIIKLKNAQKTAYEELKAYEDYLKNNNTISEAEKRNIQNEINTVKELIDNAADDTSVQGAMADFGTFMNTYKSTDTAVKFEVAKKQLADQYQDYLTKLAPYLASSDENIKAIAQKAKESMKKIAEPETAYTTTEQITTPNSGALDKLKALYDNAEGSTPTAPESDKFYELKDINDTLETFVGYKKILEYNDNLAKENDKKDKAARAAEYEKAIEILDLYETVLKDAEAVEALELSQDDIASIQSMIDATRSSVTKAVGAKEIKDALALLRDSTTVDPEEKTGFLDKYYPDYAEYASNYEFSHAQTSALNKLKEYKETYAGVESLTGTNGTITEAIKSIEAFKADRNTADEVNNKLKEVEDAIELYNKETLLEAEKTRLKNKYDEVLNNSKDGTVQADAQEALAKVKAVSLDGDASQYEEKMKELKTIETEYDAKVKKALDDIAADKEEARAEAAKTVNDIIDAYIDIAKASGRNAVVTALNGYKDSVNEAEDAEAVEEQQALMNAYIDNSCKVLKAQYDAITKLNTFYDTNYVGEGKEAFAPYLTQIRAVFDNGISAIKAIKVDDLNDVTNMNVEIEKIAKFTDVNLDLTGDSTATVNVELKKIIDAKTTLDTEKEKAIGLNSHSSDPDSIEKALDGYKASIKEELKAQVQNIIDQINAVTSDTEEFTEIHRLRDLAKTNIENYVKGGIINDAKVVVAPATAYTIKGSKTANEIQPDGITITPNTADEGIDYDIAGALKKVDEEWNDLGSTISNKTGYFVCLKIKAKYAGSVKAELDEATTNVEVIDLSDDNKLVLVKVSDATSFTAPTEKKLTITYSSDTEGGKEVTKKVYSLKGLIEKAGE